MIIRALFLSFLCFIIFGTANASDAPEIRLRGDDNLGDYIDDGLTIERLEMSVNVQAGLAQISLQATLRNETDDDAEARFSYPLPSGAVIKGYALDIDGTLVDGVLMPKERAEKIYTDRVTATIDPGIAARTADNRYQTRIYPIAADGGRRQISLDFVAPVPAEGLRLPLSQEKAVETVSIKIIGDGARLAQSPLAGTQGKNTILDGEIFIPAMPGGPALSSYANQKFLTLPLAAKPVTTVQDVNSVAIIWDTSLSREGENLASERRFVEQVLTRLQPTRQSLIHGANNVAFAAPYQTTEQLSAALARLTYDGATNLTTLLKADTLSRDDIQSDICLVLTDGRSTLGARNLPNLPCRVFTFSASDNPNRDWLALLSARNAGADLTGLGASEAARIMTRGGGLQLAKGQAGDIITLGLRQWFIMPIETRTRRLDVQFKTETKSVNLRALELTKHGGAGALWGQRRVAALQSRGPQAFDDVVAASRRWSIQSRETAFLVLESAQDYVEAKIDPPKSFPADRMKDYKGYLAEARAEEAEELANHLDDLRDEWEDQITWWETDWVEERDEDTYSGNLEPVTAPPAPEPMAEELAPPPPAIVDTAPSDNPQDLATPAYEASADYGEDEVIIVTGSRRRNPAGELPAEIKIETRAWNPERPFLTALAELSGDEFEMEYIRQRKTNGDHPSFYLEIADQLHRQGNTERAARMAATALDLQSATPVTRNNVADRLLMYGQTLEAVTLYRDVLPASQDRPQPYFNLALALIQAGDEATGKAQGTYYREAFENLIHVINSPWEDDYEGIHLIALQDLNRTLARLPKRTRRKIEKELGLDKIFYKNLPVDIRILIDWTADDADLDIHVIERVGADDEEKAYYSNPATLAGGRVSNDMTEGYGPEEYLIRRAPDGLYRVESDYYAQDAYAEDGALKLRARLWRNYGRETETHQTVIIEMLEEKEDPYILGSIEVGSTPDIP